MSGKTENCQTFSWKISASFYWSNNLDLKIFHWCRISGKIILNENSFYYSFFERSGVTWRGLDHSPSTIWKVSPNNVILRDFLEFFIVGFPFPVLRILWPWTAHHEEFLGTRIMFECKRENRKVTEQHP